MNILIVTCGLIVRFMNRRLYLSALIKKLYFVRVPKSCEFDHIQKKITQRESLMKRESFFQEYALIKFSFADKFTEYTEKIRTFLLCCCKKKKRN